MKKIILGIETSCDDTGIGLYDLNNGLIGDFKISSSSIQALYGGVVPEIAARNHADVIIKLTDDLFKKFNVVNTDLIAIAFTKKPGLKGCLMVGEVFAQCLSFLWDKPLLEIDHVYAHIFSTGLDHKLVYPFLAFVASGKTTAIFLVKNLFQIQKLNATVDDAIGETYDKVGRVMGLSYPAGAKIDQLFDNKLFYINLAHQPQANKPFSYSGIKTASINYWKKMDFNLAINERKKILATAFQRWILRSIINKIDYYANLYHVYSISIVGGVAANLGLRKMFVNSKYKVQFVNQKYATDNGAMIAYYGMLLYKHKLNKNLKKTANK